MKKYLLPKTGNFYKANLHAHTDMSDGRNSPEEVKQIFKSKGYAVIFGGCRKQHLSGMICSLENHSVKTCL